MSLSFVNIDPKLGQVLDPAMQPPKVAEHIYLEELLKDRLGDGDLTLYTGKIYDGITAADLKRLNEQGIYALGSNGRTGYFADKATIDLVAKEVFADSFSDRVAYLSILVSHANASQVKPGRVLVIDDEAPPDATDAQRWGKDPITLPNGTPVDPDALYRAAISLGDSYGMVSPELSGGLGASGNTPFQFRAGIPEWQGVIKGTVRTSELCQALGVDAIIPKSSIKGDGKSVPVGIHSTDRLFWSRKSDAAYRPQKLGAQVLVNFPEGVKADVLPKLEVMLEGLQAAQSDPRLAASLYIKNHEARQDFLSESNAVEELDVEDAALLESNEFASNPRERVDWVYEGCLSRC